MKFHDGTPWNAAAACYNFNRWYNWTGPFQDPSATFYYQATYGGFKKNEVANLSTPLFKSCTDGGQLRIIVTLNRPSGVFFPSLVISVVRDAEPDGDEEVRRRPGNAERRRLQGDRHVRVPASDRHRPVQVLVLDDRPEGRARPEPDYWGKKAKLDKIIIRPISDNEARFQALRPARSTRSTLLRPRTSADCPVTRRLKVIKRPAFNVAYVTIHQGPGHR